MCKCIRVSVYVWRRNQYTCKGKRFSADHEDDDDVAYYRSWLICLRHNRFAAHERRTCSPSPTYTSRIIILKWLLERLLSPCLIASHIEPVARCCRRHLSCRFVFVLVSLHPLCMLWITHTHTLTHLEPQSAHTKSNRDGAIKRAKSVECQERNRENMA